MNNQKCALARGSPFSFGFLENKEQELTGAHSHTGVVVLI